MSFTTRCPACGTMFRVVADQLKISEGWVRCGHCADVFDATLYLQPWTPPGEAAPPAPAAPPVEHAVESSVAHVPAADAEPASEEATAVLDDAEMAGEWAALESSGALPVDVGDINEPDAVTADEVGDGDDDDDLSSPLSMPPPPETDVSMLPEEEAEADEEVSDFHGDLQRFAEGVGRGAPHEMDDAPPLSSASPTAAESDDSVFPMVAAASNANAAAPRAVDGEAASDAQAVPDFVRQAQRRAFWQSPGMRVLLSLLVLVLGALLLAQWALHERDRLAALRPDLQPWLARACEALGCTLAPVRSIDAVVIDSTALVRRLGDFYSFDLVLKNTAPMPLAVPALELSLTDTRDQVIARRVFLPEEWPDAPALLPAQGTVNVSLSLALALGESTPMAGYRALVFYP